MSPRFTALLERHNAASSVADPDSYNVRKLDPDPHQSRKLDQVPHQSEKGEALEGHFFALQDPNLEKSEW